MNRIVKLMVLLGTMLFANVGVVKTLEGKAEVKRDKKLIVLKEGSTLENGDIVFTKDKSALGIMFDDGTRVSLGAKAIFVINSFVVKPSDKKYDVDLKLKKGKAVFSSGKIGKLSPESVKFRIPTGVIGIRGTKFAVEAK